MFFADCMECAAAAGGTPKTLRAKGWEITPQGDRCPRCVQTQTLEQDVAEAIGFNRPEDGSQQRYQERRKVRPWAAHTFWWFVHNAVAHPLIAVVPVKPFFSFHDWTSRKMHGE